MFRLPRKFSLRSMFAMVLIAVIGTLSAQRYITNTARFEVLETDLFVDGGYLSGSMSFRCSQLDDRDNIEYSDSVLRIANLSDTSMKTLVAGDEFFVNYRDRDVGPIKKENRYVIFMTRELGIQKDEIVGFVQLDGWAEVHIRGKSETLP